MSEPYSYWQSAWRRFLGHRLGAISLGIVTFFVLVGVYAPFLASSKPLFVVYDKAVYFSLFRYLFFGGFYTKGIDLFFNALMFALPLFVLGWRRRLFGIVGIVLLVGLFLSAFSGWFNDPASDPGLALKKQSEMKNGEERTWDFELQHLNAYAKLNLLVDYRLRKEHHERLLPFKEKYQEERGKEAIFPTRWAMKQEQLKKRKGTFAEEKEQWLQYESEKLHWMMMPLVRHFHWEDDAGGQQSLNRMIPWAERTRVNRKDLTAALLFGMRISLVVGITAVTLALLIGIPIGALAGYFGGTFDIIMSRLVEIWESMPTFFMLLFVVAVTQSKSIFMVVAVIGFFGWTSFARYTRGEFFKQRNLPYVEACHAMGFSNRYVMFVHILPNAIPPLLTLLPFAIMGAITSEAGLSFLGLGEEGSCSWGVLMDEGRAAFPGESYLLWPPAILLSTLLVAIALVGDAMRDTLDPKMR